MLLLFLRHSSATHVHFQRESARDRVKRMRADGVVDPIRASSIPSSHTIATVEKLDPLAEDSREHERVSMRTGMPVHVRGGLRRPLAEPNLEDPHTFFIRPTPEVHARMSLFPHQTDAVDFVMRRFEAGFGAALCYEMGLGKTFIGLGVARHFSSVVVFLPAYLKAAWHDAAEILGMDPPVCISYDAREYPLVPRGTLAILDECQYIKNRDSARWKRLEPALKTSKRLLLTGTPMLNRHCELWTQLRLMGYEGSWWTFTRRFCGGRERYIRRFRRKVWDATRSTRSEELRSLLGEHGFRFRDKSILGELPEKTSRVVPFKMAPGAATGCSLRDYQLAAERRARSESWAETLRGLVTSGGVVVFARHLVVLDALREIFPDAARIDGRHRDEIPMAGVLLCSIGAAAVGLTLTFATTCIFAECSWSAGVQAQCEARIHRIGQTRDCEIVYLLSDDPVDQRIWASIQRKEKKLRAIRAGSHAPPSKTPSKI